MPVGVGGGWCAPGATVIWPAPAREQLTMASSPLASTSLKVHYARGAIGLAALVAAVVGTAVSSAAILLLIVTVAAWRGCPTCWAIGLMQTREREACTGRRCRAAAPR